MNTNLEIKYTNLKKLFKSVGHIGIAYSGGVDSTLLLHIAKAAIPNNIEAITILSEFYPSWELSYAKERTKELGIPHKIIKLKPLEINEISSNPPDRCYKCKKAGFTLLKEYCNDKGIEYICDGSCIDDLGDYRPGYQAIKELSIYSPFVDLKFSKADIIGLSRELEVTGWQRPSCACLASRIPYNDEITTEKLALVETAEIFLHTLGLPEARVRLHDNIARLEVFTENLEKVFQNRVIIAEYIRNLGVPYVALELDGYKTGSLNKNLNSKEHRNAQRE